MNPSHTVLITAAGTGTAFGAVTALRRHWSGRVRIVTADINPRHLVTASILSDDFVQVPPSHAPDYPAVIFDLIKQHAVDTFLPLLPAEIALAIRLQAAGQLPPELRLLTGSANAATIASDKLLTAEWLRVNLLPTPRTAIASQPFAADHYFLKPRVGTGSRGGRPISAHELATLALEDPSAWVVQEPSGGPEVTVDAFFDPAADSCQAICRERIEIKGGVSTKARLFSDPMLTRLAERMARALPFAGSFCFQVMLANREWVVIDLNARPGAATAMCALTGNDFFAATFARAWGEDCSRFFRPLEHDVFVTRQYAEFVTGFPHDHRP